MKEGSDTRLAAVTQLAYAVRAFLEPQWERWHHKSGSPEGRRTMSEGTCGRSSRFLCEVLKAEGFDAEMAFGSPVECDCGFRSPEGWKGHGWVELRDPACLIDLTADQFGAAAVIVCSLDDPRYVRGYDVAGPGWLAERQRLAKVMMKQWVRERRGRGVDVAFDAQGASVLQYEKRKGEQ